MFLQPKIRVLVDILIRQFPLLPSLKVVLFCATVIDNKPACELKLVSSILVQVAGIFIVSRWHPLKAAAPILTTFDKSIEVKLEQSLKATFPIYVDGLLSDICDKDVQYWNDLSPILFKLGIFTICRFEQ